MEVLGTVASAAALTDMSGRILEFRHRIKQTPNELRLAVSRVNLLSRNLTLLSTIGNTLKCLDTGQDNAYLVLTETIEEAMRSHTLIQDMLPRRATKQSRKSSLYWVFKDRAAYEELMRVVSGTETSVTAAIALVTLSEALTSRKPSDHQDSNPPTATQAIAQDEQDESSTCQSDGVSSMTDDVQDADSTASDSTPNTGPHNSQSSHLWGLCNIVRGTAFTSSCNKKTVAVSVQVELLRWLRVRIDVLMRLGLFNGASTLSLDGGRMSLRCLVSCNHAFLTASSEGDLPTMRKLLASKQASPAMVTEGGITPLCLSIEKGHTEAVELLLSEGADVSEPFGTKRTSPLSWALKHRCPDICRMLISRGANYFDLSIHNWSPIFYLWSQTKRNEDSRSALLITMLRRRADEFPWLHQKIVDREGWGLMHRAAVFGTPADVEALMNSGVDPFQPFWNSGWRVLHNVVDFGVHDNFLILFPAYEREFTLSKAREMPDSGGWTLLHIAIAKRHKEVIQGGHDQIVRTLLRLGADWEAKTKPSWDDSVPQSIRGQACSPIRLALAYGEPRYRELLRAIDDVVCSQDEDEWCDADDQFWYDALEDISG